MYSIKQLHFSVKVNATMDLYASNNKLQTVIQEQVWEMLEIHWPALLVTGQHCQLMAEVTYHS